MNRYPDVPQRVRGSSRVPPKASKAARIGLALAGGMLAMMLVLVVAIAIPVVLALPAIRVPSLTTRIEMVCFLLLVSVGWGLAFFLGGATARCIARPGVWRGWIGAACAVAFVIMFQLLPEWRWSYQSQRGWAFATAEAEAARPRDTVLVHDYTSLLLVAVTVMGVSLAWLGDRWAARRLVCKGKKTVEQADSGGSLAP